MRKRDSCEGSKTASFKTRKIRDERDNQGKLWVWLDHAKEGSKIVPSNPSIEGSKKDRSKPSNEVSNKASIEALEAHLRTLSEQLALAQSELAGLRPRASAADRLEADVAGLEAFRNEIRADRDHWRDIAEQALTDRRQEPEQRRGLWCRLFGRSQEE